MRPLKTPFGKAISYALNQWEAMERYLGVPEAEIDNNSIEHALRGVVMGRRNWLHAGGEVGGERGGQPVLADDQLSPIESGTIRLPL